MAEVKTIKDVDDETWAEFKELAAQHNVKLGIFFKSLVQEYEKNTTSFWDKVLNEQQILTEKEANELSQVTKKVRKEYGFRE